MSDDLPRPMLASPMIDPVREAKFDARFATGWVLERKLDGHRCISQVRDGQVRSFSRPRGSRPPLERVLPPYITAELRRFPDGDYDGEAVAVEGGKSWDVVRKGQRLVYVVFDLVMPGSYDERRETLLDVLGELPREQEAISTVVSEAPTWAAVEAIWAAGGEGAILKRTDSTYQAGRRSQDWLKVKQLHAARMRIEGYEAGKSGPYSALRLRGDDGSTTSVKTLTHALLRDISRDPASFLGRELVISYQERTPSGLYRHAIFDHFV